MGDIIKPEIFAEKDALAWAPWLLGKVLVRARSSGEVTRHRIIETEAYNSARDRACHACKGRTARMEVSIMPGGFGRQSRGVISLIPRGRGWRRCQGREYVFNADRREGIAYLDHTRAWRCPDGWIGWAEK